MRIVDVAREEHACVHLAPVTAHLLAVLTAGVEVSHLVGTEHIVHIFRELCLKRRHDGELLTYEDLGE